MATSQRKSGKSIRALLSFQINLVEHETLPDLLASNFSHSERKWTCNRCSIQIRCKFFLNACVWVAASTANHKSVMGLNLSEILSKHFSFSPSSSRCVHTTIVQWCRGSPALACIYQRYLHTVSSSSDSYHSLTSLLLSLIFTERFYWMYLVR